MQRTSQVLLCTLCSQPAARQAFRGAEPTQIWMKMDMQECPAHWGTQGISSLRKWITEAGPFTTDGLACYLVEHNRRPSALAHHWCKSQIFLHLPLHDIFQHPALPEQLASDNRRWIVQDLKTSRRFQVSTVHAPAIHTCLFKFFAAICP